MNIFDSIQDTAFDITTGTFGYSASWLPSDNSPEQLATVHYKDAADEEKLGDSEFNHERHFIEYKKINFVGLIGSVQRGENEKVKVELSAGVFTEYWVKRCEPLFDGKTIKAFLIPV